MGDRRLFQNKNKPRRKNMEEQLKEMISKYFTAKKQGAKAYTLVRKAETISYQARDYEGNNKWINMFKNGETVNNKFGKKLYFKLGE